MATTSRRKRSPVRKVTIKKVTNKLPEIGITAAGLYGGQLLYTVVQKLVEKIMPPTGATAGLGGIANIATPLILTLAGIILPEFLKLGTGGKYSRAAGNGIALYGAVKSVKEILGKDVLAGKLNGVNGMGLLKHYHEPAPYARIPKNLPNLTNNAPTSL